MEMYTELIGELFAEGKYGISYELCGMAYDQMKSEKTNNMIDIRTNWNCFWRPFIEMLVGLGLDTFRIVALLFQ